VRFDWEKSRKGLGCVFAVDRLRCAYPISLYGIRTSEKLSAFKGACIGELGRIQRICTAWKACPEPSQREERSSPTNQTS